MDFRYAIRTLLKSPGFTLAAVAALTLGIGTNTAIFSVVNTVLLKPVHAPDPDRVVVFMNTSREGSNSAASEIKFNLWREQTNIFQEVSGYRFGSLKLTGVDQPQQVSAVFVTSDYFRLFGLPVARGRGFTDEEERPNGRAVVVLSDTFWKKNFGGEPRIVGKIISLDGKPCEVVGIMASGVQTEGPPPDVWMPYPIDPNSNNQVHYFGALGRLKPGVTLDMANAQLRLTTLEFRRRFPNTISTSRGDAFSVQRMRDVIVKDVRSSLVTLAIAVSFVLLMACANVANLLLVRATGRGREIAIRTALGASRGRIIRQLLTESLLLSIAGAVFGLGLGMAGIRALLALGPSNIPRIGVQGANVTMDWRVLAFTVLVALITGLLFGIIPALQASRSDLNSSLKESSGRTGTGFRQNKVRSLLVISETSLALLLLIGAALLVRTLIAMRSVNPGFDAHNVVTTRTSLDSRFAKASGTDLLMREFFPRLSALPGVERAALANMVPLDGDFSSLPFIVVGRPLNGPSHGSLRWMIVSSGYFDVLKIPLRRGRFFTDRDGYQTAGVAMINQTMARRFWPDSDPLNDKLFIAKGLGPAFDEPARQIIGIVGDVHDDALYLDPRPAVFIPAAQAPDARAGDVSWIVRVRAQSQSLSSAIQRELRQATGGLPVPPLRPMEEIVAQSTAPQNFNMLLMSIFGGSALLLAAIGIYGLMAYSVQQRTQEIGIRMALGAGSSSVRNMLVVQGMGLALIGVGIGIVAALGLTRFLASFHLLFGVTAWDPAVFTLVPVLLSAVALLAVWLPARRASRIDPVTALRSE